MPLRIWISLLATAATLVVAFGCQPPNVYVAPPPPEVTVSVPVKKTVSTYLTYTGVTKAIASVDLRARVKGFLKERNFEEGKEVKKGQPLLVIDEQPFIVKVQQAEAKLAEANSVQKKAESSKAPEVAAAQLALDQASLLLAKIEDSRQRSLVSRNAASPQDVDRADANTKKAAAQVEADRASLDQAKADFDVNILAAKANVAAAKADLDNAKIDLGYCRIEAPLNGRITRTAVDVGNLVGDGQATLLATILQDDPIYAYMSVSETDLLRFRKMVAEGKRPDYRKDTIPLELGLANEVGYPHQGKVQYTDPGVDPGTGTIQARGIFPNADGKILPGLFVRVRVPFESKQDALLVPEEALGSDATGRFVLVVGPNDVVEQKKVQIGSQVEGLRVIEGGLTPEDRVVINGLQRARPGQKVTPRIAGSSSATPPPKSAKPETPTP